MELSFRSPSGDVFTLEQIVSILTHNPDYQIYVGTDSQLHKCHKKVLYATCIVLYRPSKGGRAFFNTEWTSIPATLRLRLTEEVWRSIQVSAELTKILPQNRELTIDLDINSHKQHKSSHFLKELVGFVSGQNFKYRIKPYGWAAMSVADRFAK